MKKYLWFLVVFCSLSLVVFAQAWPQVATGAICDLGPNRAATLLVPYFEVSADGTRNTLVAITNTNPNNSIIAHVNFWNVDSFGVFDFNIYLTPNDVATFSVYDILVNGTFPYVEQCDTDPYFTDGVIDCDVDGLYFGYTDGGDIQTALDTLCGAGAGDGVYCDAACYPTVPSSTLGFWQYLFSECSADNPTDNYVGYITIDTAYTCNGLNPADVATYFNPLDLDGDLVPDYSFGDYTNVLMGDVIHVNWAGDDSWAVGYPAVHIEAFASPNGSGGYLDPAALVNDLIPTFYGKYAAAAGLPAYDGREPLPVMFGARYFVDLGVNAKTYLEAWRSTRFNVNTTPGGVYDLCPTYVDLPQVSVAIFNEAEETTTVGGGPGWSCPPNDPSCQPGVTINAFPAETQLVDAEALALIEDPHVGFPAGWIRMDFRYSVCSETLAAPKIDPTDPDKAWDQAWVNVYHTAFNNWGVAHSGTVIMSACSVNWTNAALDTSSELWNYKDWMDFMDPTYDCD